MNGERASQANLKLTIGFLLKTLIIVCIFTKTSPSNQTFTRPKEVSFEAIRVNFYSYTGQFLQLYGSISTAIRVDFYSYTGRFLQLYGSISTVRVDFYSYTGRFLQLYRSISTAIQVDFYSYTGRFQQLYGSISTLT